MKRAFKFCMLVAALAILGVSLFYFLSYVGVSIAIGSSGLKPFYQHSVTALWLTFGCQALLIGILYAIVAWKPRAVSREVIVIFGLMQFVAMVLLLLFSGSMIAVTLLGIGSICVLIGALIRPRDIEPRIE